MSEDVVNNCAKEAVAHFKHIDVLVNCAGAAANNGVLNMTDSEWQFTIDTDLTSVFYVTRAFANIMKEREIWIVLLILHPCMV